MDQEEEGIIIETALQERLGDKVKKKGSPRTRIVRMEGGGRAEGDGGGESICLESRIKFHTEVVLDTVL